MSCTFARCMVKCIDVVFPSNVNVLVSGKIKIAENKKAGTRTIVRFLKMTSFVKIARVTYCMSS